jgi:hypothetical protein
MSEALIRYTPPTKHDYQPYLSRWFNHKEEGTVDVYIQLSEDANMPHWLSMGEFLNVSFSDMFEDEKFIKECLLLYKTNLARAQVETDTPS